MSRARPAGPVVCAPLRSERAALRRVRPGAVRTGMGPARSVRAASALRLGTADGVLVAGVGGGTGPDVRPGDIVVATELRPPDGPPVACPSAPLLATAIRATGARVHLGPVASRPHTVGGQARRDLGAAGVLAADTESAWLSPGDGVAFAVVRSIVDTDDAPLLRPGTVARGIGALRALHRAVPAIGDWTAAIRPREVLLANPRSFCAGVERAIDIVGRAIDRYGAPVYVRRQVVHNVHVVRDLEQRGAVFVTEVDEVPAGHTLVLAAHGVAPAVRAGAAARDLMVIDATCPLVTKVHTEVRRYAGRGTTVFLIGHPDHEEVEGTVGEAPEDVIVVPDVHAAAAVLPRDPERVAYAMQTTLAADEAEAIASVLRDRFPALQGPRRDDICYATTNRQQAVKEIARRCDLLYVVGSANSSNAQRLAEVAAREGVPALLIDDVTGVRLRDVGRAARIGVTAGASAPSHLVGDLVRALGGLGPVTIREAAGDPEDVRFTVPREVG